MGTALKTGLADAYRAGEKVVLAGGPYQGTSGSIIALTADPNWADVTELNGRVRSYPVEWLSRPACAAPQSSENVLYPKESNE
jgi:hypothetical protein